MILKDAVASLSNGIEHQSRVWENRCTLQLVLAHRTQIREAVVQSRLVGSQPTAGSSTPRFSMVGFGTQPSVRQPQRQQLKKHEIRAPPSV